MDDDALTVALRRAIHLIERMWPYVHWEAMGYDPDDQTEEERATITLDVIRGA